MLLSSPLHKRRCKLYANSVFRSRFTIYFLIGNFVFSLFQPVMAMEEKENEKENIPTHRQDGKRKKRGDLKGSKGLPLKKCKTEIEEKPSNLRNDLKRKRVTLGGEPNYGGCMFEWTNGEEDANYAGCMFEWEIVEKEEDTRESFRNLKQRRVDVTPFNFVGLPLEIQQCIVRLVGRRTRFTLRLVDWHTYYLIMADPSQKKLPAKIPDLDLEKPKLIDLATSKQSDESDRAKRAFGFTFFHVSERLAALESQGQQKQEKAKAFYIRTLLDPKSPLQDSRLIAYKAGLFMHRNKDLFSDTSDVDNKRRLAAKVKSAAISFLEEAIENRKKKLVDHRNLEALYQLYLTVPVLNVKIEPRMAIVQGRIENAKKAFLKNPSGTFPAYLLRLIALYGGLSNESKVLFLRGASIGGDAMAQFELSQHCRRSGIWGKSEYWLEKAAEKGHLEAMYKFGALHLTSHEVLNDAEKAIKYLTRSASRGHAEAQYDLSICYATGYGGVQKDMVKATNLCAKAAKRGHVEAQSVLGSNFGGTYDVSQQVNPRIYLLAQSYMDPELAKKQFDAGLKFANGTKLVKPKWDVAAICFARAALQGHKMAQLELSLCYKVKDHGVPQNPILAEYWKQKSEEKGRH